MQSSDLATVSAAARIQILISETVVRRVMIASGDGRRRKACLHQINTWKPGPHVG